MADRRTRNGKRLRKGLDEWFFTITHYLGIGLLGYALFVDRLRNPALLPTATGLILLRNVAGGREE